MAAARSTKAKANTETKIKTETKARSKPKPNPKTKAERAVINRQNAQKSTGPRTEAGKGRSCHNAVTHGMTARSPLLPGEDADALAALQRALVDDLQPRNQLEARLIGRLGAQFWRADHSERAVDRRAAFRLRHESRKQSAAERTEALELGERLLWKPNLPIPFESAPDSFTLDEPRCIDDAKHPHNPGRLLIQLESSVASCAWLIQHWSALNQRLNGDDAWRPADAFRMVRLMGKHAIEIEYDFELARLLLCSLALSPRTSAGGPMTDADWSGELVHMVVSFGHEHRITEVAFSISQCKSFHRRLAALPLARLAPANPAEARAWLTATIEARLARVRHLHALLREIALADADQAPARLAFEEGPEGDKHRRYLLSNDRLVNRTVAEFLQARKLAETGSLDFDATLPDSPSQGVGHAPEEIHPEPEPTVEPSVSVIAETACGDNYFLRNEAKAVKVPTGDAVESLGRRPTLEEVVRAAFEPAGRNRDRPWPDEATTSHNRRLEEAIRGAQDDLAERLFGLHEPLAAADAGQRGSNDKARTAQGKGPDGPTARDGLETRDDGRPGEPVDTQARHSRSRADVERGPPK
jgi:hypothetical protein